VNRRGLQVAVPPTASLVLAAAVALSGAARADPIDDIVASEIKRQHSPAIALAVVRNGLPVKVRGYGIAHLEHRAPATAATLFQTASVGKQFTAALVMLMVRDGKVRLDDPVATTLPDAPAAWSGITVRHLLNHTAGLESTDPAVDLQKDYSEAELLASAYKVPLKSAPGERFAYSNLGYQVLGFLCARVGGRHWGEQMRDRMFLPLGMADTRVISEREVTPGRAAGYERFEGAFENQRGVAPTLNTTADGSLYVSARDPVRWSAGAPGLLTATTRLDSGMHQFKIGDAEWKLADFGARFDEALVKAGWPQSLAYRGEDLFLEVTQPGDYTFELDLRPPAAPRLTVIGPAASR